MKHQGYGVKISAEDISLQADLLDIPISKKCLRDMLICFGNTLVKDSVVILKKQGGLSIEDIEIY